MRKGGSTTFDKNKKIINQHNTQKPTPPTKPLAVKKPATDNPVKSKKETS